MKGRQLGLDTCDGRPAYVEIELPNASAATSHLQVWKHGANYMLQQVDGPPIAIAGESLALPIVVLEDGDEISAGEHRFLFESAAQ